MREIIKEEKPHKGIITNHLPLFLYHPQYSNYCPENIDDPVTFICFGLFNEAADVV
jgi:hypothetical protein